MYTLRFDMRLAPGGTASTDLYESALEMAEWADGHGCMAITLSEHHGSDDGYLPAPLVMAAAVAARTKRVPIQLLALIGPLHEPVRLAEELAVLDIISRGRVSVVVGLGYRREEFDLYGVPMGQRAERLEALVGVLRRAWAGEALTVDGQGSSGVRVTPAPATPGGPLLFLGGGSAPAARRAARLGLGMITERSGDLKEQYLAACAAAGTEPQFFLANEEGAVTAGFVDPDPSAAWERLGPFILRDAATYAEWNQQAQKGGTASVSAADTVGSIRMTGYPYRVFTPAEAADHIRTHGYLTVHPLCGGAPPDLGWATLHRLVDDVIPRVAPR